MHYNDFQLSFDLFIFKKIIVTKSLFFFFLYKCVAECLLQDIIMDSFWVLILQYKGVSLFWHLQIH